METVADWLNGLAAEFCDEGIIKLVQLAFRKINMALFLAVILKLLG
jgi:hypothetical protein